MRNVNKTKIQILTNIGAILEYYDYIIFAYLIPIISILFFPSSNEENFKYINDIKVFLLFSVGSCSRLFGSFILGFLSTKYSKSFIMILSIYLMGISTLAIGLLPTYIQIGALAPILLLLFRFMQGVAYCVELPSSSIFIFDYFKQNQAKTISFLIGSSAVGSLLATFIMYLLAKFFAQDDILNYLWRVPFLVGGVVGIFGIYIRKSLINNYTINQYSISQILKTSLKEKVKIVESILFFLLPTSLIIIYVYLEPYLTSNFSYSKSQVYLASSLGLIFSIFSGIFTGTMIDKNKKNYINYCYCFFLLLYPSIWLALYINNFFTLLIFVLIFQFFIASFIVFAFYRINLIFDKDIKSILIIIIYNFSFILSSFIPLLAKQYGVLNVVIGIPFILSTLIMITAKT